LGADSAAWQRIAETLVGAAVGVAANLLFPPKVPTEDAGRAIDGLADSLGELLRRAAEQLSSLAGQHRHDLQSAARSWLGDARQITHDIPQVGAALLQAEQSRRLNVRAAVTADVGPGLRQGMEALEHSAVAIRGMFRAVVDAAEGDWLDDESAEDVLLGLAHTFGELAAGVDTFGQLVRDESEPHFAMTSVDVDALREALEGMHEARARLEEALVAGLPAPLLELHAVLLATVKRLQREMDLDERIRRQVRLRRPHRSWRVHPGAHRLPEEPFGGAEPDPDAETQVLPAVPRDPRDGPGA
jgi:gas vesicle protein